MTAKAIDIEVHKPMWVVEVFSTRRNAWEQDGGDSAYSKEEDARGHVRSIRSLGTPDHRVRISYIVYGKQAEVTA